MAFPYVSGSFWLPIRVDVKNDAGDLTPIGGLGGRIEEAQVRDEMLLVVGREHGRVWCGVSDGRIKRWLLHLGSNQIEHKQWDSIIIKWLHVACAANVCHLCVAYYNTWQ